MTASSLGQVTVVSTDDAPATGVDTCQVCGHLSTAHDSIANRYCAATQHNALARGCLCR